MKPSDIFTVASHALDIVRIDPTNPEHIRLFAQAYEEIYMPAFLIPEEREAYERLIDLSNGADESREVSIFLAGRDLADPDKRKISGVLIGSYFYEIKAGLLAYIAIDPSEQGNGLGRLLIGLMREHFHATARMNGDELNTFFVEVKDPAVVNDEIDPFGAEKRLNIYHALGARLIPFNFIGPSLTEERVPYECDNLMFFPTENKDMPSFEDVRNYLHTIYNGDESEPGYQDVMDNFMGYYINNADLSHENPMSQPVLPNQEIIKLACGCCHDRPIRPLPVLGLHPEFV